MEIVRDTLSRNLLVPQSHRCGFTPQLMIIALLLTTKERRGLVRCLFFPWPYKILPWQNMWKHHQACNGQGLKAGDLCLWLEMCKARQALSEALWRRESSFWAWKGWEEQRESAGGRSVAGSCRGAGTRGQPAPGKTSQLSLLQQRWLFKWNLNLGRYARNFPASPEDAQWQGQGYTGQAARVGTEVLNAAGTSLWTWAHFLSRQGSTGCAKPPVNWGKQRRLPKTGFSEDNSAKY